MGDFMIFKIGDLVTRNSYHNDLLFKIIDIEDNIAYLKGIDVRLYADSELDDLQLVEENLLIKKKEDREEVTKLQKMIQLDRSEYFYLPGKILHLDGDKDYLERCISFYKEMHLEAYGINIKENKTLLINNLIIFPFNFIISLYFYIFGKII